MSHLIRTKILPALLVLAFISLGSSAWAEDLPSLQSVRTVSTRYFDWLPHHRAEDILSRTQVAPLFKQLKVLGWKVRDINELNRRILPDSHFVVERLRTPQGQTMMRKISKYPLVYDKMDRLSSMPGGKELVAKLLSIPDGETYFRPRPTPGLNSLTELLPKGRSGKSPVVKDFNSPTGKIYTQKEFMKALEESYAKEVELRSQAR